MHPAHAHVTSAHAHMYIHTHIGILLNNKIGDATMKIVELECRRYEMRMEKGGDDGQR